MPRLIVTDEFEQTVSTYEYDTGITLPAACMQGFPEGFPGKSVVLIDPDGNPVEPLTRMNHTAQEDEDWTLLLRPREPTLLATAFAALAAPLPGALGAAGVTWATVAWGAISLIGLAVLRPSLPDVSGGGGYEWDDDGAPQYLSAQSNQLRLGNRVPDVFGTVRVWPDLITEPYIIYSGDSQQLRELYVVSNGVCDISEWRLSDELLSTFPTSNVTTYQPGNGQNWPVSFPIVKSNAYVGGIELPGPNETISFGETFELRASSMYVDQEDYFSNLAVGSHFKLAGDGVAVANTQVVFRVTSISVDGRSAFLSPAMPVVENITDGTLTIRQIDRIATSGGVADVFNTGWVSAVSGTYYSSVQFGDPGFNGVMVEIGGSGEVESDWFRSLSVDNNIVNNRFLSGTSSITSFNYVRFSDSGWNPGIPGVGFATAVLRVPGVTTGAVFDVQFPSGLYFQAAGKVPKERSVDILMAYRLVGTTTWNTETFTFTAKRRTPARFSTVVNWADLGQPNGEYETYFERLSDFVEDTSDKIRMDAVELTALRGIQDITDLVNDPLNVTLVEINLTTQNAAQVSGQRRFNVLAQRQLPDWLGGQPNILEPTNRVTDAIMYTAMTDGGYDESNINTQALIDIQADLDAISVATGEWNGIIDQTMTVEDQLRSLAGPARMMIFRRGAYLDFKRIGNDEIPKMLINSRTKVGPETKTMSFSLENEPDAILVRYRDAADNYKEATVQWPPNITPTRASEQTLLGVTDGDVALQVAEYTWNKGYYEQDILEVSIGEEGVLLSPGDVVVVSDALKSERPIEGEITAIQGTNTFTFDEVIPNGLYIGRVRSALGDSMIEGAVTISETGRTHQITEWASITKPTDPSAQVGLLYEFVPVGTTGDKWIVTNIEPSDEGPVRVSGVNYEPLVFTTTS